MHSFQPSRGRIFFEVLCAVGIGASCGGAWMQTGASALLAAAFVATLYGLVHFFDLFRHEPSLAAEPQRIDFAPDGQAELSTVKAVAEPEPPVEEVLDVPAMRSAASDFGDAEVEPAEPAAAPASVSRRPKAPRKENGRSAAKKKSKVTELTPVVDLEVAEPAVVEEVSHIHVAPLFEPDPFHRMPRQAFGRRGQI